MENNIAIDILPLKDHLTEAEPVPFRTRLNKGVPKCVATR